RVVYLPDTYLPSDDKRRIAEMTPSRISAGLPESAFVFCSFNNTYKFTPELFRIWMHILGAVEASVLWLPACDAAAQRNLKGFASEQSVDPTRLIFAPHLASAEEHLARLRLGDLFLDTLPCNAHTTASDALWAGLPVLTCKGTTFAGRVAASVLAALDLPELVTDSLESYERAAVRLARDAAALSDVRAKLARNRDKQALFDTARFMRQLEGAFPQMGGRSSPGEPPQSFSAGQSAPIDAAF